MTYSDSRAAGRPHMRFVPEKTTAQQALLVIHRLREYVSPPWATSGSSRTAPSHRGPGDGQPYSADIAREIDPWSRGKVPVAQGAP